MVLRLAVHPQMGRNGENPVALAELDDVSCVLGLEKAPRQQFPAQPLDLILVEISHRIAQLRRRSGRERLQAVPRQLLEDFRMIGIGVVHERHPAKRRFRRSLYIACVGDPGSATMPRKEAPWTMIHSGKTKMPTIPS